jgi:uncharacterized membrane protein
MFTRKSSYVFTFIAAIAGAVFGGLWGEVWGNPIDGLTAKHITLPAGIISGFLACFAMSVIYIRYLEKKGQNFRFSLGALFGTLAGMISGAVTGASMAFAEPFRSVPTLLGSILLMLIIGTIWGGLNGAIIGLISTGFILTIPPVFRKLVSRTAIPQNIAGLTCYFGICLTGLIFIISERKNRFIRFHAMQSTIAFGGLIILWFVLGCLPHRVSFGNIDLLDFPEMIRAPLVLISGILWLLMMVGAYSGKKLKLPLVGMLADKYAGGE